MRSKYRIIKLKPGRYAIQKKSMIFGWTFITDDIHQMCALTFNTIGDAEKYFVNPVAIESIIKEINGE